MKTIIIFAKVPESGKVKTRLFRDTVLDARQVSTLYDAFLRDTITIATLTSADRIAIHFTPAAGEAAMKKIAGVLQLGARNEKRIVYIPQTGVTFTERIKYAFNVEKSADAVAMIGADSPLLKPDTIDDALDFIDNRQGFALGPSGGGGLYLIGHSGEADITYDTLFSEGSEFENFCNEAKRLSAPLMVLPETLDVDLETDLVNLTGLVCGMEYSRNFGSFYFCSHTYKAIEKMGLIVVRDSTDTRNKKIAISKAKPKVRDE